MKALDKHDMKLLSRVADEGPLFMKHPSHEMRAADMRDAGYLACEQAVYSMRAGGASMEIRNRYAITDKGRLRLTMGATALDDRRTPRAKEKS